MKTAVILLGLFVAFAAADGDCPLMNVIESNFEKCADMTNADERMIKNVMYGEGIDDDETNCFRACIMMQAGFMRKGKLNIPKMEDLVTPGCVLPKLRRLVHVTKFCRRRAENSDDGCQVAQNYMRCYQAIEDWIKKHKAEREAQKEAEEQKAHERRQKEDK